MTERVELLIGEKSQIHSSNGFCATLAYDTLQCDAISWEQFKRRCRMDSFNKTYLDEDSNIDQIYKSKYVHCSCYNNDDFDSL